jgi:hypothetical protein
MDGTETDGTETDGTETDGTETDGTETDGTETDGTETDGTETDGTETDGTDTDGTDTDGIETDGTETDGTEMDGTEMVGTEIVGTEMVGGVGVTTGIETVGVGLPGVQSKPIDQIPNPQLPTELPGEIWKPTEVAPPHWELLTEVPSGPQCALCLQIEPSGMPKRKSTSVSFSAKTSKLVMENPDTSAPQLILGPDPAEMLPSMHLPWTTSEKEEMDNCHGKVGLLHRNHRA